MSVGLSDCICWGVPAVFNQPPLADFQVAQSVVDVTHQYKELFVYDNAGGMN
jgi:hypothetical protein